MQNVQPNLFTRDDTFFGVCEALGEDLGFNPLWLRLAVPPLLFANPVATIGGYFAVGAVVLASRLIFPKPRVAAAQQVETKPVAAARDAELEPVPLAA